MDVATEWLVSGMTCDHCAQAVRAQLQQIAGVSRVGVDLTSGRVEVDSAQPLDRAVVLAAVQEAGYELVGP